MHRVYAPDCRLPLRHGRRRQLRRHHACAATGLAAAHLCDKPRHVAQCFNLLSWKLSSVDILRSTFVPLRFRCSLRKVDKLVWAVATLVSTAMGNSNFFTPTKLEAVMQDMFPTLDFLAVDLEYDRLLLQEEIPAQEASSVVTLRNRGFLFLLASIPCPLAPAEGGGDLKY